MSSAVIEQPSDVFDAIAATLQERIAGITIGNYDEFGGIVGDAMVLIEFEQASPVPGSNDGRPGDRHRITLHGLVARHRRRAPVEALNLASAISRVARDARYCRWGFSSKAIRAPENVASSPSVFMEGERGYDGWGVSFEQIVYLGDPAPDPEATPLGDPGMPMIVWNANDPDDPRDIDNPDDYRPASCEL